MNEIEYTEYCNKCSYLWGRYGREHQFKKLVEELAELVVAISKNDFNNILEEMADVQVLFDQINIAYPNWENTIERIKNEKVNRQIRRIDNGFIKNV